MIRPSAPAQHACDAPAGRHGADPLLDPNPGDSDDRTVNPLTSSSYVVRRLGAAMISGVAGALSLSQAVAGAHGSLASALEWSTAGCGFAIALAQARIFWAVLWMDPIISGHFPTEERWEAVRLLADPELEALFGAGATCEADRIAGVQSLFLDGERVGSLLVAHAPSRRRAGRYVRRQARRAVIRGVGFALPDLGDAAVYASSPFVRSIKIASREHVLCLTAAVDVATASLGTWRVAAEQALGRLMSGVPASPVAATAGAGRQA